jgi:hypothetical protein
LSSAGLRASSFVSVDGARARHAGRACYTTQFGSDRFTAFRTGPSKSRLAFLRNLLGGMARYGVNAAAAYMRAANLAHGVIEAFRVGYHALCWVHAERLVHKLVPANDRQRSAVEVARRMIWWFYRQLKAFKLGPSPERAAELRARFDRIFKRRTGYATLDRLLKRLLANKDELLRVLERPEIPLNTNASKGSSQAGPTAPSTRCTSGRSTG